MTNSRTATATATIAEAPRKSPSSARARTLNVTPTATARTSGRSTTSAAHPRRSAEGGQRQHHQRWIEGDGQRRARAEGHGPPRGEGADEHDEGDDAPDEDGVDHGVVRWAPAARALPRRPAGRPERPTSIRGVDVHRRPRSRSVRRATAQSGCHEQSGAGEDAPPASLRVVSLLTRRRQLGARPAAGSDTTGCDVVTVSSAGSRAARSTADDGASTPPTTRPDPFRLVRSPLPPSPPNGWYQATRR